MVNFEVLEPLIYIKHKERTVIGFKDLSTGKYTCGLFHDHEPMTVHGKLVGYTYYGFATYFSLQLEDVPEMVNLLTLFADDIKEDRMWWEDDSDANISDEVRKLAEYLNDELEEELSDDFLMDLKKKYEDTKKPRLTLVVNEILDQLGEDDVKED